MLREEDILVESGRCVGGRFVRVVHLPTGISRSKAPMDNTRIELLLQEIEEELRQQGKSEHLVARHRTNAKPKRKK